MTVASLTDVELEAEYAAEILRLGIYSEAEAIAELDERSALELETWSRIDYTYPLAGMVLWERPDEPWDQRRLVVALALQHLTLVLGGNGSGKTHAILQMTAAQAMGGDHPAVRSWLHDNDLPPELVPPGPADVCLVAPSAPLSIEFHRKTLDAILPAYGKHWRLKDAPQEASVEIQVPGYTKVGRIYCKSVDQKHRAFKGGKYRWIAISEEPEGTEGELVMEECLRATARVGGRTVIECTPQNGFTWVYDKLAVKRMYGCEVVELDSEFNVLVDDHAGLMRWFESMPAEQRAMRQKGKFTDLRGLMYSGWVAGDGDRMGRGHLVDDFDIPEEWPRFMTADWGQTQTSGTAVIWGALADDGTLFLYRIYYMPGEPSFRAHAQNCRALMPMDETVSGGWADHEQMAIDEFAAEGMPMELADKDVRGGVSRCSQRLMVVGTRPRLKVFRSVSERFAYEIGNYRRDPNKIDGAPIKRNDHVMDAWRYLENGLAKWVDYGTSSEAYQSGMEALFGGG